MRNLLAALLILTTAPAIADTLSTMSVSGMGEVSAAPDMATITLGAAAEAKTAEEALNETSERVAALLAALSAVGVEEADVQTSGLSVRPLWTRAADGGQSQITGFAASNDVRATVRDLEALGGVLAAAMGDGANTMGGLQFGLSDRDGLEDTARERAVADALRKAAVLAAAAGVELGSILTLTEGGTSGGPAPVMRMAAEAMADVPVAPGEMTVSATVSITFAIE